LRSSSSIAIFALGHISQLGGIRLAARSIMFKRLLQTTNDPVFTIIRLVLGLVFFAHGAQKMLGWFGGYGFSGTLSAFSASGMPTPLALFVIVTEFFASAALICGAFARVVSGAIALLMVGAVVVVHAHFGFYMNWFGQQKGEGFEYHLLAIGLAVAVLVRGTGSFSMESLLSKSMAGG
jgi:putative oxidoreductase